MRALPLRHGSTRSALHQDAAQREAAIMTLTQILLQARQGQNIRALEGLAAVIVNRMRAARMREAPASWGMDLAAAARAAGTAGSVVVTMSPRSDDPYAPICRRIAARAASGALSDPTGGAVHWHRHGEEAPADCPHGTRLRIGNLVFIRPDPPRQALLHQGTAD